LNCIFCEEIEPEDYLFENELAFAIYDKYPVSKGHVLVIPKRHFPNYFNATKEEIVAMNEITHVVKDYLDEHYEPHGYNVGVNVHEAAGQTIFHMHIHIIPRHIGDVEDPRGGIRNIKDQLVPYKG